LNGLTFGNHELVIVLDGPDDAEFAAWRDEFNLVPTKRPASGQLESAAVRTVYESKDPIRLVVIDLERAGVASALNAAVNAALAPVVALFDPESDFQTEALLRLIRPMLDDAKTTIAVCGVDAPPPSGSVPDRLFSLVFLRMWLSRCSAFSDWNVLLPIPGSGILLYRDAAIRAGGFKGGTLELFLRLHRAMRASKEPYRIAFVPNSGCKPRPPQTLADVRKLVVRDQGEIGRIIRSRASGEWWTAASFFWIRVVRPMAEFLAYLMVIAGLLLGWVSWQLAALVLLATIGTGLLLSMGAVSLRELAEYNGSDPARLSAMFFASLPENLWFRHLRNLWIITAFGKRPEW
jgi:cellulose synthase/poly-beta-1,6-N-acetylglucosamine synthase-like glycosyltransferase